MSSGIPTPLPSFWSWVQQQAALDFCMWTFALDSTGAPCRGRGQELCFLEWFHFPLNISRF